MLPSGRPLCRYSRGRAVGRLSHLAGRTVGRLWGHCLWGVPLCGRQGGLFAGTAGVELWGDCLTLQSHLAGRTVGRLWGHCLWGVPLCGRQGGLFAGTAGVELWGDCLTLQVELWGDCGDTVCGESPCAAVREASLQVQQG